MLLGPLMVDSGYWLALSRGADQHHVRARAWQALVEHHGLRLLTTDWVLLETLRALTSRRLRVPRAQALAVISAIQDDPGVAVLHVSPEVRDEAWRALVASPDRTRSWTDASTFILMRRHGIQHALAYDRHFEDEQLHALLRSEPAAYA